MYTEDTHEVELQRVRKVFTETESPSRLADNVMERKRKSLGAGGRDGGSVHISAIQN